MRADCLSRPGQGETFTGLIYYRKNSFTRLSHKRYRLIFYKNRYTSSHSLRT